jgi:hypothetical protein
VKGIDLKRPGYAESPADEFILADLREPALCRELIDSPFDEVCQCLTLRHVLGPQGVRGRRSDNTLIRERLRWSPGLPLAVGLERTYRLIAERVAAGAVDR